MSKSNKQVQVQEQVQKKNSKLQVQSVQKVASRKNYTDDDLVNNATQGIQHWMKPNRVGYNQFVQELFEDYYAEVKGDKEGKLFPHQQLVKNYLAGKFLSPIRGILALHTLGSGKSRTAVTVINALFYEKKIIVLTPASLKQNFQSEIMSFGLEMFRLENNWKFIDQSKVSDSEFKDLASRFNIPHKIIKKIGGFWTINDNMIIGSKSKKGSGKSNFYSLNDEQQEQIKFQIKFLMEERITFMSYNGLRKKKLDELPRDFFNNALIVVDEIHNVIRSVINGSRIMNQFYEQLLNASNSKFILLSATPIINKPSEIAFIINLLHGYINVLTVSFSIKEKMSLVEMKKVLDKIPYIDFYDIYPTTGKMDIKLTPIGYTTNVSKGKGIEFLKLNTESSTLPIQQKIKYIIDQLSTVADIGFQKTNKKLILVNDEEEFNNLFVNFEKLIINNSDALARRMIGSVSYYNVQDPAIFPAVKDLEIQQVPMSEYQYTKYTIARDIERVSEMKAQQAKGKALADEQVSVYKTFSRLSSDFVFPEDFDRPFPSSLRQMKREMDNEQEEEDIFEKSKKVLEEGNENDKNNDSSKNVQKSAKNDEKTAQNSRFNTKKRQQMAKIQELGVGEYYAQQIEQLMADLDKKRDKYLKMDQLQKYSPKFYEVLLNLNKYEGTHLIYSQFRNVEGLGVLKIALQANGYGVLKIKNKKLDIAKEDLGKPLIVEFGSDREQNEILKSLYNNRPNEVNTEIVQELLKHYPKSSMENFNRDGQMIKIMMIGVSGTEGLSLRNTRYVHVMESYFNNVRIQQVVGRAKRAKSHEDLPLDQRFVKPFMYISSFTKEQLDLKDHGITNIDDGETSDQTILKIAVKKETLINQLLDIISQVSIDCNIQKKGLNQKDRICYKPISNAGIEETLYKMNLIQDLKIKDTYVEQFKAQKLQLKNGIIMYYNQQKNQLIDYYTYEKDSEINIIGYLKEGKLFIDTSKGFVEQKIQEVITSKKLKDIVINEDKQTISMGKNSVPIVSFMYGILK